jgi:hypothetical protein
MCSYKQCVKWQKAFKLYGIGAICVTTMANTVAICPAIICTTHGRLLFHLPLAAMADTSACYKLISYNFLSLGFHGWSSKDNFGFRGWAALNVENYPTFQQTMQLPSSG